MLLIKLIIINIIKKAVHIDIPKCVSSDFMYIDEEKYNKLDKPSIQIINKKIYDSIFDHKFEHTMNIINNSKKPIIYLGQGCR